MTTNKNMAYLGSIITKVFVQNVFVVILYSCCVVQILSQNNNTIENDGKIEFKKWYMGIKDFNTDKCNITSVSSNNIGNERDQSHLNKLKLLNVVSCSTGKGRWNYRLKVIENLMHYSHFLHNYNNHYFVIRNIQSIFTI